MTKQLCELCLEECKTAIELTSEEGLRLNISQILQKHFQFFFEKEPRKGSICTNCWTKVESFHEFYLVVEEIHNSIREQASVFVEVINSDDTIIKKEEVYDDNEEVKYEVTSNEYKVENNFPLAIDFPSTDYSEIKNNVKTRNVLPSTPAPVPLPTSEKQQHHNKRQAIKQGGETVVTAKKPRRVKRWKKNDSDLYQCEQCDLTYLTEFKLYCHVKEIHMNLPFKCTQVKCVESYDTQQKLDEHLKQNHKRSECLHCNKKMASYYLPTHIKLYHDKDQRIVCDACGHVSNNMYLYQSHHRIAHEVQPKLQCDICKDWVKNKHSLRLHMRIRHIEKPQTCSICGKISANKTALNNHMRYHGEGVKDKYKCTVCGRGFRDSTKLREHSYIHSGISDVYQCNYCDKSFRFGSSMYAHRKKVHPIEEQYRLNSLKTRNKIPENLD